MKLRPVATFIVFLAVVVSTASLGQSIRVESAFQKFWLAKSPAEASKATGDIVKSGITFDEAVQR